MVVSCHLYCNLWIWLVKSWKLRGSFIVEWIFYFWDYTVGFPFNNFDETVFLNTMYSFMDSLFRKVESREWVVHVDKTISSSVSAVEDLTPNTAEFGPRQSVSCHTFRELVLALHRYKIISLISINLLSCVFVFWLKKKLNCEVIISDLKWASLNTGI